MTETEIMRRVQRCAPMYLPKGARLFRNNTGVLQDKRGQYVRYGLIKGSADLIGWTPIQVEDYMVGHKIAVFCAIEVKTEKGKLTKEQANFLLKVKEAGGISTVVTKPDELVQGISEFISQF